MISDSTGIPPSYAEKAGFTQETYGSFKSSALQGTPEGNHAFKQLWQSQPRRALPFRFGYLDSGRSFHLLTTRRSKAPIAAAAPPPAAHAIIEVCGYEIIVEASTSAVVTS